MSQPLHGLPEWAGNLFLKTDRILIIIRGLVIDGGVLMDVELAVVGGSAQLCGIKPFRMPSVIPRRSIISATPPYSFARIAAAASVNTWQPSTMSSSGVFSA